MFHSLYSHHLRKSSTKYRFFICLALAMNISLFLVVSDVQSNKEIETSETISILENVPHATENSMTDFSQLPESLSNRAPQAEQIVRTTVSGCYQNSGSKFTVSALIDWDIAGELTVSLDGGAQTRIIPVDYTTKNFTYNIPTLQEIAFELDADGSTGHTIEVYYTATPATIIASTTFDAPDSCEPIVCGINDLGGFVFQDYNSDGVNQSTETQGLAAVTVTAIDVNGGVHATTTDRYGLYVLPIPSDDYPVRVEFTDIPANPYLSTSTPVGTNNDTTVQFIDAPTCNVDLGVNNPLNNCGTSDPLVVTSCYVKGDPLDLTTSATYTSANLDVLVGLPYSDSITPSSMEHLAVGQQMGATWGQAYDLYGETLYSTPILRRHVGLGPDGIGAILRPTCQCLVLTQYPLSLISWMDHLRLI